MSDILRGFSASPGLACDEVDEDYEGFGSILSWNEDDEDEVADSVAATTSAIEDRANNGTPASTTSMLPSFMNIKDQAAFMQQLSSMGGGAAAGWPSPATPNFAAGSSTSMTFPVMPGLSLGPTQQQVPLPKQQQQPKQQQPKQQQQQQPQVPAQVQQQQMPTQAQVPQQQPQVPTQPQALTAENLAQMMPNGTMAAPAQGSTSQVLSGQQQQLLNAQAQQARQAAAAGLPGMIPGLNFFNPTLPMPFPPAMPVASMPQRTTQGQQQQQVVQQAMQQQRQQSQQQDVAQTQMGASQADVNSMFLRQMQQAAVGQMQQAAVAQMQQQFAAQQPRPLAPQPPKPMVAPSAALPPPSRRGKRKADGQTINAAGRSNIVSASDTDGETVKAQAKNTKKRPPKKSKGAAVPVEDPVTSSAEDMSHLTPEEKAKVNRDRNREHARNTRLRKKAYLEKLKTTVDELCRERDTLVSERAGAANLLVEMHNTRTEVLMSFFALRSSFEKRRELWSSILDESCFACVMPVTPYRSFPASEVQVSKCQRTILGIDGMMADTASLHVLLNTLVDRVRYPTAVIEFRYTLVTEDAVVAGNQMMARWVMSTVNATQCGARMEVAKQGMLCCKFNSAHKIVGLELMFDVMAFMLQLKQAAGSDSFSVVPNTVQTCQRSFDKPMVMTLAERPYTIVQVNQLWEQMTGYGAEDVVGKASCRILQGQETDRTVVESLMLDVRFKRPSSAMLMNYTRSGKRFRNYLNVYPLSTDSKITHYVALTSHVDMIDVPGGNVSIPCPPAVNELHETSKPAAATPVPSAQPPISTPAPLQPMTALGTMKSTRASALPQAPALTPQQVLSQSGVLVPPGVMGQMLPPSSITEAATAASVSALSSSQGGSVSKSDQ